MSDTRASRWPNRASELNLLSGRRSEALISGSTHGLYPQSWSLASPAKPGSPGAEKERVRKTFLEQSQYHRLESTRVFENAAKPKPFAPQSLTTRVPIADCPSLVRETSVLVAHGLPDYVLTVGVLECRCEEEGALSPFGGHYAYCGSPPEARWTLTSATPIVSPFDSAFHLTSCHSTPVADGAAAKVWTA